MGVAEETPVVPRQGGQAGGHEVELRPPAFVGRRRELATLTGALGRPPALVLVEGEAGVGKTRLVNECLAATSPPDGGPLVAACPPLREPLPLGPLAEALRGLRPQVGDLPLSPLAGALRPLFPEWADRLPAAVEQLPDPQATRQRLFAAVGELLERLAVEVLVVEDLQWADTSTLELLLVLSARRGQPVSLVVTYRPEEVPPDSLLRQLTSRSPAGLTRTWVGLEPLSRAETGQLVASMLATEQVSEEFGGLLHERTDGMPLALEETVLLLADRRDLIRRGGEWARRTLAQLQVPPTVRDLVWERISRLDPGTRRLLEAAAVLAEPAEVPLLAAVAGLDDTHTDLGVAAALGCGLLQESPTDRFSFRHVLASRAAYEAIPAPERRRLHRLAADALRGQDPPPLAQLAHHFREANNLTQWSHYAEAAAEVAMESGSDQRAILLLHELLTAATHPPHQQARLARKLAEAALYGRSALGELADQVTTTLRRVLTNGELPPDQRGEIRLLLGQLQLALGMAGDATAYADIETAVEELDHHPALAARAMLHLGWAWTNDWPAARHLRWLQRAGELVSHIREPAERLSFQVNHATALLMLGEDAGWQAAAQIPTHGATQREQQHIARALLNIAQCEIEWGRFDDARRRLDQASEQTRACGYLRMADIVSLGYAHLDWYTGRWDGMADAVARVAEADETEHGVRLDARLILSRLALARDGPYAAEQRLRELLAQLGSDRAEAPLPAAATLARLHLANGSTGKALQVTASDMRLIATKGIWLWATDIAPVHIEALVAAGQIGDAEELVRQFAAWLAHRNAPAPAAALASCRAILAEARDDAHAAAADLYAEATAAWAALPRPYEELLALERHGRCLLADRDQDRAIAALGEAEARLSDLGARWDADRVAHLLRQHRVEVTRGWRGGQRGYGDQLTPRELDVVRLVATGLTNRQVAEQLYLSRYTVTQHLQAAMRKLGVASRTAVAMAASSAGLLTTHHESSETSG